MIEAMKQALEALEDITRLLQGITGGTFSKLDSAITSLRQAIQEEALRNVQRIGQEIEQEKGMHDRHCNQGEWKGVCKYSDPNCPTIAELESQEPIANLEIVDLGDGNKLFDTYWLSDLYSLPFGDYLLYTHPLQRKCENCGEFGKCCMEAESQERNFCPRCGKRTNDIHTCTPPQRTWVGLTDEEMYLNCPNWLSQEQCKAWIQQIEAKLKEKNT